MIKQNGNSPALDDKIDSYLYNLCFIVDTSDQVGTAKLDLYYKSLQISSVSGPSRVFKVATIQNLLGGINEFIWIFAKY